MAAIRELALAVCAGLRGEGADEEEAEGDEADHFVVNLE